MCGIVGIFHDELAFSKVKVALALLATRGEDGKGIASAKEICYDQNGEFKPIKTKHLLGHTLHAVVNHVPQPLKKRGILVANCEIYNWRDVAKKYNLKASNDAELLLLFLDKFGLEKMEELDGVYAFAYWLKNKVYLVRDLLGEKPVWYSFDKGQFAFASEKKVLGEMHFNDVQELNPRQILCYDIKTRKMSLKNRDFFRYLPEHASSYNIIKEKTARLLDEAIEKRIPQKKFGLLFSGGVDSTFLAKYLNDHGYNFTCYTAVLETTGIQPADLQGAQEAARVLGLNLKIKKITVQDIPSYLRKIVPLIEDSNVVKVGVALTFYVACEMAREDGCKVIFSGLGSEELFAGYERHKKSQNINQECLSGLRKMYERDLYRDDVVTMKNGLELRLPFLDLPLVQYALKIPSRYKIDDQQSKKILRQLASERQIPSTIALRKKTAAQYGSKFDAALEKIARERGYLSKSAYLYTFYPHPNLKLGVLFSSGKDSAYAAYIMQRQNYELTCLITLKSKNPHSYMFQSAGTNMVTLQARAMELPLILQETKGEKEEELNDLKKALRMAQKRYHINGIVTGAVFSTYQRDRIEKICDELGLKIFAPLWHKDPLQEMKELLQNKFEFIFSAVAAEGLGKQWLNVPITEGKLKDLEKISGIMINGEGGEFESLVLNCPLFKKRIELSTVDVEMDGRYSGKVTIRRAKMVEK